MRDSAKNPVEISANPAALAQQVAAALVAVVSEQLAQGRTPRVCLTGGRIAEQLDQVIARSPSASELAWDRVEWWWGDERFVPSGSEQRNEAMARRSLLDKIQITPGRVHPMPASDNSSTTLQDAADSYTSLLTRQAPEGFDIVLLSLGPDGHIASLFPGSTSLSANQTGAIAIRSAPKPPPERITLTLEALAHTKHLWIMASGREKASAVNAAMLAQATDLPTVSLSQLKELVWYLDQDAASQLVEKTGRQT